MGWFINVSHPRIENPSKITAGTEGGADIYDRVRQVVEVVTAWKALSSGVRDRASAVKMTDKVLKHLTVIGSSGTSGTMTSTATQSRPATSKRKATAAATGPSKTKGKKSRS
ncbi:hypothetical protein Scep_018787 [Stephania cephalantha]|uniref:Uncharacterized protein n=1 Tax=Stephania cephalantha TaxID=152367 RepID=A0AAP0I9P1_9MAGN